MASTADSARDWAESGLGVLWEDFQSQTFPMTFDQAGMWLRAAYGSGYMSALVEEEPVILADALENNAILQVLVPVT